MNMNKVIAGEYLGKSVAIKTINDWKNKIQRNLLYIKVDSKMKVFLTSETLESYEIIDLDREKTAKNIGKGLLIGGTAGAAVGLLASDGGVKLKVYFKDGTQSMLQLNNSMLQKFLEGAHDVKQHNESVMREISNSNNEENIERKKIKQCKYCKCEISADKEICDNCSKQAKKNKKGKFLKTFICIILVVGFIGILCSVLYDDAHIIEDKMGVNEEQAQVIKETLEKVGVESINEIAYDDGLNDYYMNGGKDKGYRVAFRGTDTNNVHDTVIVYINEDGSILAISEIMGNVLYENGEVKNKLNKD